MKTGFWIGRAAAAALALALLSGCAPFRTEIESDESASLASARSYRWETPPIGDAECSQVAASTDQAVRAAVDERMADAGFRKAEGRADLVVDYHIAIHAGTNVSGPLSAGECVQDWRSLKGRTAGPSEQEQLPPFHRDYELSIHMTDEQHRQLWRGSTRQLHSEELDDAGRIRFVDQAADEIMKAFAKSQKQ